MATISTISCYQGSAVDDYDFTLDDADMGITARGEQASTFAQSRLYFAAHIAKFVEVLEIFRHTAKRHMISNIVIKLTTFGCSCDFMMWPRSFIALHKKKITHDNKLI